MKSFIELFQQFLETQYKLLVCWLFHGFKLITVSNNLKTDFVTLVQFMITQVVISGCLTCRPNPHSWETTFNVSVVYAL